MLFRSLATAHLMVPSRAMVRLAEHRMALRLEAAAERQVARRLLQVLPVPRLPMRDHLGLPAAQAQPRVLPLRETPCLAAAPSLPEGKALVRESPKAKAKVRLARGKGSQDIRRPGKENCLYQPLSTCPSAPRSCDLRRQQSNGRFDLEEMRSL